MKSRRNRKYVYVCLEGAWDYFRPVKVVDDRAAAKRWVNRDKKVRLFYEVPYVQ